MADFEGLLSDQHVVLALCAIAILFVLILAAVMACTMTTPFCVLNKYCPFGGKVGVSGAVDRVETTKVPAKTKRMIFYGQQQLPVPGTKASYLDNHQKTEVASDISGLLMADKYRRSADLGFTLVKQSPQTSTAGSADENAGIKHRSYLAMNNINKPGQLPSTNGQENLEEPSMSMSFSLQYDKKSENLTLYVSHVTNLGTNFYGGLSDSFVRIFFIKDTRQSWLGKSEITLENLEQGYRLGFETHEQQTKIVRRSANPVFNEYFCASNMNEKDKKRTIIKFILCTVDKYLNAKTVGYCEANLGKADLTDLTPYDIILTEFHPDLGEVLLTLTYLPTSQRLNVTIIKITNIKRPGSETDLNPLVKLALIQKGRTMEKHVTSVHYGCNGESVYNEQFFFDLPFTELNKVVLLCSVYHKISTPPSGSPPDSEPSSVQVDGSIAGSFKSKLSIVAENSVISRRSSDHRASPKKWANGSSWRSASDKKTQSSAAGSDHSDHSDYTSLRSARRIRSKTGPFVCLGRVAFGTCAKAPGRTHWLEVIRNPRKQVSQTHSLQQ